MDGFVIEENPVRFFPVRAQTLPMIRSDDDQGIIVELLRAEKADQLPDGCVRSGDGAVV